ncbi:MAG: group II intron reverse transcriptase/maturase [Cyanobacteria bacterium REEB67]|nr:group II intron reverse transcriptase/maturase [Cyanobacteria bacterium REEB67]
MTTQLSKVAEKAKEEPKLRFNSLAHLLTPEFLRASWQMLNKRGAAGVDGETIRQYEANLEANVSRLHARLRAGQYKAPPVRRVEIPKGEGKVRMLGIPTVEDRLLQAAVARILNAIYEPIFLDCSYGYRPKRSAHDALRCLRSHLIGSKVMQIFEADIRAYFDRVNHDWLRQMLRERISDPVLLRLIDKWLRAGVMDNGLKRETESGVPQGGPVSCILSNIYLHYVLDLWFEKRVKRACNGQAHLVRYVDDFVACFQYKADADKFNAWLRVRFGKFNIELAEEKTRCIMFGRFAKERLKDTGRKTDEFEFLGFRHICGEDRNGKFALVRLPRQKSCRKFLDRVRDWLKTHIHWKVRDQRKQLSAMLKGFYQYYALPHCGSKLFWVHGEVVHLWRNILKRRSQRSKTHWSYLAKQDWFNLPHPRSLHATV